MSGHFEPLSQKPKYRILMVEAHAVVRQGITELVNQQPDLVVCGAVSNAYAALDLAAKLKPDLVLSGMTLQNSNGLELVKILAAQHSGIPILILSMHQESLYAEWALQSGAMGYIMKDEPFEKLLIAIYRVLSGKIYVSENMTARLIQQQIRGAGSVRTSPEDSLSGRELQVFQLIGQWRKTGEIAKELHLSVKTVEYYREKIKEKLGINQAAELTRFATEFSGVKGSAQ